MRCYCVNCSSSTTLKIWFLKGSVSSSPTVGTLLAAGQALLSALALTKRLRARNEGGLSSNNTARTAAIGEANHGRKWRMLTGADPPPSADPRLA